MAIGTVIGGYTSNYPITAKRHCLFSQSADYTKIAEGLGSHFEKIEHPKAVKSGQSALFEIIMCNENVLLSGR